MLLLFGTAVRAFIRELEASIASAGIMVVLITEKSSKQEEKYFFFFFSQTYILHNLCCNPPCCLLKASYQNSQDNVSDKIYKV